MADDMNLTVAQQFELERFGRAIDATDDMSKLRDIAKMLLQGWKSQQAACAWLMRQGPTMASLQREPAPAVAPWDDPLA
jgi:hypothetical protein